MHNCKFGCQFTFRTIILLLVSDAALVTRFTYLEMARIEKMTLKVMGAEQLDCSGFWSSFHREGVYSLYKLREARAGLPMGGVV